MKYEQIKALRRHLNLGARDPPQPQPAGHTPPWAQALSRRQFLRMSGTALLGASLGVAPGARLWPSPLAGAPGPYEPIPIPGGTPFLGGGYHVFGPGTIDPPDAEPSSITDFDGFVGISFTNGMCTRTNTQTGEVLELPFVSNDMRFMKGTFRGMDGGIHHGAFGFVWVDVYEPGPGPQLHDLNPTEFPPTGLFWTLAVPTGDIEVNPGKGKAVMHSSDVPILDFGTIPFAIFGGGPPAIPGIVSYTVVWSGVEERLNIKNTDPVYGGFAGEFARTGAQMEWTATVGDYEFVSAPLETSTSLFAEVGHERNGMFFP